MVEIFVDGEAKKIFKGIVDLIEEAKEKGVCPCYICKQVADPGKCGAPNCYAWYAWFSEHWQNIKEAARRKGYRV